MTQKILRKFKYFKTYKHKVKGGSNNIGTSIEKLKNNFHCSTESECHYSLIGINKIVQDAGYVLRQVLKQNKKITNDAEIIQTINFYLNNGGHFIISLQSYSHFWYIETNNKQFRILSLWASKHGFYDYMMSGQYGQFKDSIPTNIGPFILSVTKLLSNDPKLVKEANIELFGINIEALSVYNSDGNMLDMVHKLKITNIFKIACISNSKHCKQLGECKNKNGMCTLMGGKTKRRKYIVV